MNEDYWKRREALDKAWRDAPRDVLMGGALALIIIIICGSVIGLLSIAIMDYITK